MTYVEKIMYLTERFELTKIQLSGMLGISKNKIKRYLNETEDVSERDKISIDRAIKVQAMLSKHVPIDEEVENQKHLIERIKSNIKAENIDGLIAESMYLGLMLANKNEDEYVLRKVRSWRK